MKHRFSHIADSYRRFPATTLSAVLLFLVLLFTDEGLFLGVQKSTLIPRLYLSLTLSIFLFFFLESWLERKSLKLWRQWLSYGLALAILLYVFFILTDYKVSVMEQGIMISLMGLILAFFVLSQLDPRNHTNILAERMVDLLKSILWTLLFSLVLFLGILMIFVMLQILFFKDLPIFRMVRYSFYFSSLVFAVPFMLSGLKTSGESHQDWPKLFLLLIKRVLLPLSIIYTIILYIFFLRILITRSFPQGIVSHLVLWYSLLVIFILFFLRSREDHRYYRIFAWAILPLLGMLFVSIGLRIDQYGFTINRYFVLSTGIWAFLVLFSMGLKTLRPRMILISFVLFLLLVSNSPFSAHDVSVRSQRDRLLAITGEEPHAREYQKDEKMEITSIVNYLQRSQDLQSISYIPENYQYEDFEKIFGFSPNYDQSTEPTLHFYYAKESYNALDISNYSLLLPFNFDQVQKFGDYRLEFKDNVLSLWKQQEKLFSQELKFKSEALQGDQLLDKTMEYQGQSYRIIIKALQYHDVSGIQIKHLEGWFLIP